MSGTPGRAAGLLIIWEFQVRRNQRRRFEKIYGPDGIWARFFGSGKGYIRTELLRDSGASDRYYTLDFWNSRRAYESFRRRNIEEYERIDKECEAVTTREELIGYFRADQQS